MNRIDNYDPDIDQDIASEIIHASQRKHQLDELENVVAHQSWWNPNYEMNRNNLHILRQAQADYEKRADGVIPDEFAKNYN
mgnify:CR=1 FL=1